MNDFSDQEEIEVEAQEVEVAQQPIELYKVLKIANAVNGGGEAKMAISEGYVAVNGEIEQRKRCKIYAEDLIEFNGEYYFVICDQEVGEPRREPESKLIIDQSLSELPKEKSALSHTKQAKASPAEKSAAEQRPDGRTGRKSIKF